MGIEQAIVLSVSIAVVGIFFTNRHTTKITTKMGKETSESISKSTNKMIQAARKDGVNCIEKDIVALANETKTDTELVMKAIRATGEETLKSIEKDGEETRQSIMRVHESIKGELGK